MEGEQRAHGERELLAARPLLARAGAERQELRDRRDRTHAAKPRLERLFGRFSRPLEDSSDVSDEFGGHRAGA